MKASQSRYKPDAILAKAGHEKLLERDKIVFLLGLVRKSEVDAVFKQAGKVRSRYFGTTGCSGTGFCVMRTQDASQMRALTLVPQAGTPMQARDKLDPRRELMIIAVLRLVFPDRFIPASLDVDGLTGLHGRLAAGANGVTSLVPPGFGLSGAARNSLDIADAGRTTAGILPELEKLGSQSKIPNRF